MKLKDKTIVVTGGSVGIGLAVSKKIASEGGTVIIFARDKNNLLSAVRTLNDSSGKQHHYFSGDVGKLEDVKLFSDWIKRKFGQIHGLVNCAGIYGPIGKTTSVDMNEFLDAIKINLMGTIYMCNSLSNIFSNTSKKKIVNFSGGGGGGAFPNYSAYAVSKAGIVRFTENLSIELLEDNFDVNCVGPGFVATRIHDKTLNVGSDITGKSFYESTKKQLENGSVPPEKAADLTAFLLSEESNDITGKFISAPWDAWQDLEFQNSLKTDKDFATLRRIDNKIVFKK